MAQLNANLANVDGQIGFEILPAGWYRLRVANSEIKEGPKGNYISWNFEVVGKPNKIWDIMSLGNEISMQRLKGMAIACGHKNPNFIADTEELHGLECMGKIKIKKDDSGEYEPKNVISAFKPIEGVAAGPALVATPEAKAAPAPKAKMPWERP
jgi:hypothetical protein